MPCDQHLIVEFLKLKWMRKISCTTSLAKNTVNLKKEKERVGQSTGQVP